MGYLDYYHYQAQARRIQTLQDVERCARDKAHIYDRIVLPWLPADRSCPIAELGCGHGSFLHWLKTKKFSNVAGVDSSAEQVRLARQVGFPVDQDDVNRWLARQPRNHYAALVAMVVVEHLSKDDFMVLLRSAHAALAPGGCLILSLPNGDSPFVGRTLFNDITHVWTYTPNCLRSLAEMHGFSGAQFADEGAEAIRGHRWLKVPLAKLSTLLLHALVRCATRERIEYWHPLLWARLVK